MRSLPGIVLLLLCLPTALAQAPAQPEACGPITMEQPAAPLDPLSPGAEQSIVVAVTNGGTRAVVVTVAAAFVPAAEGWTLRTPEQNATIDPDQNQAFSFTLVTREGADPEASVTFTASGACALALPVPGAPCPPQTCTAASPPPVSVALRAEQPRNGGIPLLDRLNFPLEYLVAGVALVGVAAAVPFLLRKKGGGFVADCPEPLKMVRAGRGTSFPVEIRNPGAAPVTAQFDIGPVPEGWTAFMPLPEVQLAPRESRSLWLMVRAPAEAAQGDAADVEIRLRNLHKPEGVTTLRVRAEVHEGATGGAGPAT